MTDDERARKNGRYFQVLLRKANFPGANPTGIFQPRRICNLDRMCLDELIRSVRARNYSLKRGATFPLARRSHIGG